MDSIRSTEEESEHDQEEHEDGDESDEDMDEDRNEDKRNPRAPVKRQHTVKKTKTVDEKLQKLRNNTLPPSSVSWSLLVKGKVVIPFRDFLLQAKTLRRSTSVPENQPCITSTENYNGVIKDFRDTIGVSQNEGFPMVICALSFIHITKELNHGSHSSADDEEVDSNQYMLELKKVCYLV